MVVVVDAVELHEGPLVPVGRLCEMECGGE